MLDSYLNEIELLASKHIITEIDLQVLRSSPEAYSELMRLTLGEDQAFQSQTPIQILERYGSEIKQQEADKLTKETNSHKDTRRTLNTLKIQQSEMISKIFRKRTKEAKICSRSLSIILGVIIGIGLFASQTLIELPLWIKLTTSMFSGTALVFTLFNLTLGTSIRSLTDAMEIRIRRFLLERDSRILDIRWEEHGIEW